MERVDEQAKTIEKAIGKAKELEESIDRLKKKAEGIDLMRFKEDSATPTTKLPASFLHKTPTTARTSTITSTATGNCISFTDFKRDRQKAT